GQTVTVGSALNLFVQASGTGPLEFEWLKDGSPIAGASSAVLQIASVQSSDAASYTVKISNAAGTVVSDAAVVNVVSTPVITTQPASRTVTLGSTLNLTVQASGTGPLQYQWFRDGAVIPGATSATFQIASAQSGD